MRLYWVHVVTQTSYDFTWNGFETWMWTAVEIDLGVICASLPTLKPLVKKFLAERARSRAKTGFDYFDKGLFHVNTLSNTSETKQPRVSEVPLGHLTSHTHIHGDSFFDGLALHPVTQE